MIADFGQAGDNDEMGTERFTAKEVLCGKKHSKKSDIFSLGLSFAWLISDFDASVEEIEDPIEY